VRVSSVINPRATADWFVKATARTPSAFRSRIARAAPGNNRSPAGSVR